MPKFRVVMKEVRHLETTIEAESQEQAQEMLDGQVEGVVVEWTVIQDSYDEAYVVFIGQVPSGT